MKKKITKKLIKEILNRDLNIRGWTLYPEESIEKNIQVKIIEVGERYDDPHMGMTERKKYIVDDVYDLLS
jgi:hypothetical protein